MDKNLIFGIITSIVLVAILLTQVNLSYILTEISSISPVYLLLGLILYLLTYLFRALRFRVLLGRRIDLKDLFRIVCVHNMINSILPARTGELSYVYLTKKRGISTAEGLSTLIIVRIFDFITISLFFCVSVFLLDLKEMQATISDIRISVGIFMLFMISILICLVVYGGRFMDIIEKAGAKFSLDKHNFVKFLLKKGRETSNNLGIIKKTGVATGVFLFSFFIWVSLYLMVYVLTLGMGINLSIAAVIVGSTFPTFAFLLPIQGLAGLGTFEGAWTVGFMMVEVPKELAIASGFSYHIIYFAYLLIFGVFGVISLKEQHSRRLTSLK